MKKLIIDCDPGVDDAVALLLAFAATEQLDILGVTVGTGNVPLAQTLINALKLTELARVSIPVHAGADRCLLRGRAVTAKSVHGADGLAGANLPPPKVQAAAQGAVDFIRSTLRHAPARSVTVCLTGPHTNLAMALLVEPTIVAAIDQIVFMGGAITLGNVTPAAEFNIFVDPEAAHIVLGCGAPIVMVPLEVTHKVRAGPTEIARIASIGNPQAATVASMLDTSLCNPIIARDGGMPIHDAVAIAWLLAPELMQGRHVPVAVDYSAGLSRGRTLVDWRNSDPGKPFLVLDEIDSSGFFNLLNTHLIRYGQGAAQ